MSKQIVQMDYAVIGQVSSRFCRIAQRLRMIAKILKALIEVLKNMAFCGPSIIAALIRYLERLLALILKLAKLYEEFCGDLARAIDDHKRGDYKGKTYFGEGVRG